MVDWFALAAAVLVLLLLLLLFPFVGCSVLFSFDATEDLTNVGFHIRFDPSLGGFNGFEWPPPEAFSILVRIRGLAITGEAVDEVASDAALVELVGNGLVGYEMETTLPPGDYEITCQVFAPGQQDEPIVSSDPCSVPVGGVERTISFWADPGSDRFNPCEG